jgi:hypothetical protein
MWYYEVMRHIYRAVTLYPWTDQEDLHAKAVQIPPGNAHRKRNSAIAFFLAK